jgi:hypothetical protein
MSALDDEVVQRLSHRPTWVLDSVICAESPERKYTPIHRECLSLLGQLDSIPLELMHECLAYLDVLSLQRLSRVCLLGRLVVESLPKLRSLTKAVGNTLEILARAHILGLHSVDTLCTALHSESCVSCGSYGPFLHLLSAQRCCFSCLVINESLWMISLPASKTYFRLTSKQCKRLPAMWSISGKYRLPGSYRSKSSLYLIRLTSVRAAKELALKVRGSLEALESIHPLNSEAILPHKLDLWRWYREAVLQQYIRDPCSVNDIRIRPIDPHGEIGAIPFPSLLNGRVEQGHWCRGCEFSYQQYELDEMGYDTFAPLVPQGCHAEQYLRRMQYRAWPMTGFLQHAKQ